MAPQLTAASSSMAGKCQWDDLAECPECEGTGYVDTHYDNSSHDVYCKGDD